jgi:hypothetical protein
MFMVRFLLISTNLPHVASDNQSPVRAHELDLAKTNDFALRSRGAWLCQVFGTVSDLGRGLASFGLRIESFALARRGRILFLAVCVVNGILEY